MRCLGRTETDRKITNEPWSSKQSLTEQRRPLFGVKGVVCPKKEKREQKLIKKVLTRAGIVRDIAYEPKAPLIWPLNWTEVGRKSWGEPLAWHNFLDTASRMVQKLVPVTALSNNSLLGARRW